MGFDLVIENGLWFDGTGAPPAVRHLGIRDGRVAAVSVEPLDTADCPEVVDAAGKWVTPGFVDVHTHYDAELLAAPGLGESLRHGVTTVVLGSCSIGTVHVGVEDAADLFSRVEAVPREHVLDVLGRHKAWDDAASYVAALERLPLGPNVTSFLGHSDMRTKVMGLDRATRDDVEPTDAELREMERLLEEALDAGFIGMSEQRNPWDRLDGERFRSRTLPSTYASWKEYRRLHRILRRRGRVLQGIPNLTHPEGTIPYLFTSIGWTLRGRRPPLKVTFLTAADTRSNPYTYKLFAPLARFANKLGGDFRWQHVPAPFVLFADGVDLVVFEEFGAGAAALHIADPEARTDLLRTAEFRARFRKDMENRWAPRVWNRRVDQILIVGAPDEALVGRTIGEIAAGRPTDAIDTFLDLVIEHGSALRWTMVISNHRPDVLDRLSALPEVQIGFADSGAHLRNMAFYNFPLHLLYRVRRSGFMTPERAVHRLTGELADWFGLDAGHLRVGDRADLVIIDPEALDARVTEHHEAPVAAYGGLRRMVNRNDATVAGVYVAGTKLFGHGEFTNAFERRRTGRFLRAGEPAGQVDPGTLRDTVTA